MGLGEGRVGAACDDLCDTCITYRKLRHDFACGYYQESGFSSNR